LARVFEQDPDSFTAVDEQWLTTRTSVQLFADRLTALGTWLADDNGKSWVGVPLTVHRRCDQPMFDIVNAIAYDGLMIDGTAPTAAERFRATYPQLDESTWYDVVASAASNHWILQEATKLDEILTELAGVGVDMSQVLSSRRSTTSPTRSVHEPRNTQV
jgi:hypothetical protein